MLEEFTELDQVRAASDLRNAVVVGLDLSDEKLDLPVAGALFLDCTLSPDGRRRAAAGGALEFTGIPDLPYQVQRSRLYTPTELFAGFDPAHPCSYACTLDAKIYQYSQKQGLVPNPLHALAQRLHDHYITEALNDALADFPATAPVAVMGGHSVARDSRAYRRAVQLGAALGAAGFTVITGGGPGVMEAVPLGVRVGEDKAVLRGLARVPTFGATPETIGRWIAACPDDLPTSARSRTIGIPTWFYGHEPPNPACESHAKYFANSLREHGLVTVATGGIIYTPGSAGTLQEVFQDYCQNHYGPAAPMVFLDKHFWRKETPAAPLVQRLARRREAERWILVTNDIGEAVEFLCKYRSQPTATGTYRPRADGHRRRRCSSGGRPGPS